MDNDNIQKIDFKQAMLDIARNLKNRGTNPNLIEKEATPNKIIDNLYVGDIDDAYNYDQLKKLGITHILAVGKFIEKRFPKDFTYRMLEIDDYSCTNIKQYFPENYEFLKNALENKGSILIHCWAGVSRSVTCMIAFLMEYKNISLDEATKIVKTGRKIAFPNDGFVRQLKTFEKELMNKKAKKEKEEKSG